MPNHFHLLTRIKSEEDLFKCDAKKKKSAQLIVSQRFGNFFNGYAQAFNKQQDRWGSLFMQNFKRKKVSDQRYLFNIVPYIHLNPVNAGLCRRAEDWEFSSYRELISFADSCFLAKKEVMEWFDNRSNFIYCHNSSAGY
jgi:putative transposase